MNILHYQTLTPIYSKDSTVGTQSLHGGAENCPVEPYLWLILFCVPFCNPYLNLSSVFSQNYFNLSRVIFRIFRFYKDFSCFLRFWPYNTVMKQKNITNWDKIEAVFKRAYDRFVRLYGPHTEQEFLRWSVQHSCNLIMRRKK